MLNSQQTIKLNADDIQQLMSAIANADQNISIIMLNEVHSTNDYLLDLIKDKSNEIKHKTAILAELQTAGKGSQGRIWVSPPGNIYLSLYWQFKLSLEELYGLSVCVGIAIVRVLKTYNLDDVQLKWPNDVFWQGRKLCGVLIETKPSKNGSIDAIIGIGLNVQNMGNCQEQINQKIVDLENATQHKIYRSKLVAQLLIELNKVLTQFAMHGFESFIEEWRTMDSIRAVVAP